MIYEGKFTHLDMLVQMVKTRATEYIMVMDENKHDPGTLGSKVVGGWSPPVEGTLKPNWDAVTNGKGGKVGMGVVIRNHNENYMQQKAASSTDVLILLLRRLW